MEEDVEEERNDSLEQRAKALDSKIDRHDYARQGASRAHERARNQQQTRISREPGRPHVGADTLPA